MKCSYKILLVFLASFIFIACEKVFMEPDVSDSHFVVFDDIWQFTDEYYSFFDYKDINWEDKQIKYRAKINEDMSNVEFFDLCAKMLYHLRDGHVNLTSSFDRSRNWEWYLNSPENFYYSIIERYYFKNNERYLGPLRFLDMGDIIYVYYGSFANSISKNHLDILMTSLNNKKGLIFDVRNNGGGNPDNGKNLAERFAKNSVSVGFNYVKSGPGHEDFRKEEIFINPYDGDEVFHGKVVVLTNRKSYSATTYFAQFVRVLDNVTLVGDTTGGGGGLPAFRDLPNGWKLRVSSTRFICNSGLNIESGVPPDYQLDITAEEVFANKKDPIIEKAIEIIRNQ